MVALREYIFNGWTNRNYHVYITENNQCQNTLFLGYTFLQNVLKKFENWKHFIARHHSNVQWLVIKNSIQSIITNNIFLLKYKSITNLKLQLHLIWFLYSYSVDIFNFFNFLILYQKLFILPK